MTKWEDCWFKGVTLGWFNYNVYRFSFLGKFIANGLEIIYFLYLSKIQILKNRKFSIVFSSYFDVQKWFRLGLLWWFFGENSFSWNKFFFKSDKIFLFIKNIKIRFETKVSIHIIFFSKIQCYRIFFAGPKVCIKKYFGCIFVI